MAMPASAIRFAQEEREWIDSFAAMNGKSFSTQVRDWVRERIEDELDTKDLLQAITEDDGISYSFDELLQHYEERNP
jgi:predicted DNA-binding protein